LTTPPAGTRAGGHHHQGKEAHIMTPQMQIVLELVVLVLRIFAAGLAG
jgi:hypothetical protein